MTIKPIETLLAFKAICLQSGLNCNERRVGATLIDHVNRKTGQCDPGLARISRLLGISTRTVIRSIQGLEAAGLFKKIRHGGHSNRNFYLPIWARFTEVLAHWDVRFRNRGLAASVQVSPRNCQVFPVGGDSSVNQTCQSNPNKQTCKSRPAKEDTSSPESASQKQINGSLSQYAAECAAERRWTSALHERFVLTPLTYGDVLGLITPQIQLATTQAEMHRVGAGLEYLLNRLGLASAPGVGCDPDKGAAGGGG